MRETSPVLIEFKQLVHNHPFASKVRKRAKRRANKSLRRAYRNLTVSNCDDFTVDHYRANPRWLL